uniref:Protein kinase domain-containing protein n=1 Tax=Amphilophus citrinellus TaxID=61819 RepID=A0A3Q0RTN6_AMPCI
MAFLGEGCCGFVTRCRNTETNQAVAIKVNKDTPPIREQAQKEILMLKQLQDLDPDSCNIVKWNGLFLDRQHICLNFELLDQSLLDYIRDRYIQGLPISQLRPILYQLINALSHLSSKEIVHTDLKTDNLMVVDRSQFPVKVKIIDFGLARNISSLKPDDRVQNRWHRAPEAMIGAPLNQAIDMWSLGLIAVELATGLPLYPGETDYTKCYFVKDNTHSGQDLLGVNLFLSNVLAYKTNFHSSPLNPSLSVHKEFGASTPLADTVINKSVFYHTTYWQIFFLAILTTCFLATVGSRCLTPSLLLAAIFSQNVFVCCTCTVHRDSLLFMLTTIS